MLINMEMKRFNDVNEEWDELHPKTGTGIIYRENLGVSLESSLRDYDKHIKNNKRHLITETASGNSHNLIVNDPSIILEDGQAILLTLTHTIDAEATLNFNNIGDRPIVTGSGDNIAGGQTAGSILLLIWMERCGEWLLMFSDSYEDTTKVYMPVYFTYDFIAQEDGTTLIVIPGYDSGSADLQLIYGQTILNRGVDFVPDESNRSAVRLHRMELLRDDVLHCIVTEYKLVTRRGYYSYELKFEDFPVTLNPDVTELRLPYGTENASKIDVMYNQLVLTNGVDYNYDNRRSKIIFVDRSHFEPTSTIIFHCTSILEVPGIEIPRNGYMSSGTYRYKQNILHEEYIAEYSGITVIPVPHFNKEQDELTVIRDNKLLVLDVDYTIDELGQVILLTSYMNAGEQLFFTILQGTMKDVPEFMTARSMHCDGNVLSVNLSQTALRNFLHVVVMLEHDLPDQPMLKCIGGPAIPILSSSGEFLRAPFTSGSFLSLMYNDNTKRWYATGTTGQVGELIEQIEWSRPIIKHGTANFPGNAIIANSDEMIREILIPHGMSRKPDLVYIHPSEDPTNAIIGNIWFTYDDRNISVGNTGSAKTEFTWTAIIYPNGRESDVSDS